MGHALATAGLSDRDPNRQCIGPHPQRSGSRVLWLPRGWVTGGDGVHHLAEDARKNIKRGFPSKHPLHLGRFMGGQGGEHVRFPRLPCFAQCPDCRRPQKLDPDELEVEATPLPQVEGESDIRYVPFWYLDQKGGPHRVDWPKNPPPVKSIVINFPDGSIMRMRAGAAPDAE